MEKFNLEYFEAHAEERRIINEATSESLTKEIFESYAKLFETLSDVFVFQKNKGNVHGNGSAVDSLRKTKSLLTVIIKKTEFAAKQSGDVDFSSKVDVKKTLGEFVTSLGNISNKITGKNVNVKYSIIPAIFNDIDGISDEIEPEETEEVEFSNPDEEVQTQEESTKPKRRKKIFE